MAMARSSKPRWPFLMSKYWAVENQSSAMFKPGERFHRITRRSASWYGSGCRSSALATLKIDVFAPIPMASDSSAATVKPGFLTNPRTAYRRFRASVFMHSRDGCHATHARRRAQLWQPVAKVVDGLRDTEDQPPRHGAQRKTLGFLRV